MSTLTRLLFAFVFVSFLSACGGGGSSDNADSSEAEISTSTITLSVDTPSSNQQVVAISNSEDDFDLTDSATRIETQAKNQLFVATSDSNDIVWLSFGGESDESLTMGALSSAISFLRLTQPISVYNNQDADSVYQILSNSDAVKRFADAIDVTPNWIDMENALVTDALEDAVSETLPIIIQHIEGTQRTLQSSSQTIQRRLSTGSYGATSVEPITQDTVRKSGVEVSMIGESNIDKSNPEIWFRITNHLVRWAYVSLDIGTGVNDEWSVHDQYILGSADFGGLSSQEYDEKSITANLFPQEDNLDEFFSVSIYGPGTQGETSYDDLTQAEKDLVFYGALLTVAFEVGMPAAEMVTASDGSCVEEIFKQEFSPGQVKNIISAYQELDQYIKQEEYGNFFAKMIEHEVFNVILEKAAVCSVKNSLKSIFKKIFKSVSKANKYIQLIEGAYNFGPPLYAIQQSKLKETFLLENVLNSYINISPINNVTVAPSGENSYTDWSSLKGEDAGKFTGQCNQLDKDKFLCTSYTFDHDGPYEIDFTVDCETFHSEKAFDCKQVNYLVGGSAETVVKYEDKILRNGKLAIEFTHSYDDAKEYVDTIEVIDRDEGKHTFELHMQIKRAKPQLVFVDDSEEIDVALESATSTTMATLKPIDVPCCEVNNSQPSKTIRIENKGYGTATIDSSVFSNITGLRLEADIARGTELAYQESKELKFYIDSEIDQESEKEIILEIEGSLGGEPVDDLPDNRGVNNHSAYERLTTTFDLNGDQEFTKISLTGEDLPNSASQWSCVRDNVTGYVWEVKTADDTGIHAATKTYHWSGDGDIGSNHGYDDWNVLVDGSRGYCGFSDWRVPNNYELDSTSLFTQQSRRSNPYHYFPEMWRRRAVLSSTFDITKYTITYYLFGTDEKVEYTLSSSANAGAIRLVRGGQ